MINKNSTPGRLLPVIAAFFGFFIMGFVDIVGIATNYIKQDFRLSAGMAGTLPMLVFLWFAVFSIPTGVLMGKIGRKKTVLLSLSLTTIAMFIPFIEYNFTWMTVAFVILGVSNAILQVSLNPLIAAMFTEGKTASVLTAGQFIKAIASFLGPIVAGFCAGYWGDWKITFIIFGAVSFLSVLLLSFSNVGEIGFKSTPATFNGAISLLKDRFILFCFLSIFLIVGFDVGMNVSIPELLMSHAGLTLEDAGYGTSIYFAAKTIGSFLGAFLLLKTKPIRFLILAVFSGIVGYVLLMFIRDVWVLRVLIFILGFACANVFSIIFSFALQKAPSRSNEISALMIMGIVGGAVIPFLQGMINDLFSFTTSLSVILFSLVIIFLITLKIKRDVSQ